MSTSRPVHQLARQIRGVTYAKADASSTPFPGSVAILRAGNIREDGILLADLVHVPRARVSDDQLLRANDVLIATSSGSVDVVGKAVRVTRDLGMSFGAFCKVLRPAADVDGRYFAYYFQTATYRRTISALASGVNINNLRNEHLDELVVPIPPVAEQHRIADLLDKADSIRHARQRGASLIEDLLGSAFTHMFGDANTNPHAFTRDTVGNVLTLKSGDFLPARQMNGSGPHAVYGGNGINGRHSEYMFDEPVITIGRVGVYCGAVHRTEPKSWVTDNAMYVSSFSDRLDFTYLEYALRFANLNRYASQAAQPLISAGRIYPVEILVPPRDAQRRFASFVAAQLLARKAFVCAADDADGLFRGLLESSYSRPASSSDGGVATKGGAA